MANLTDESPMPYKPFLHINRLSPIERIAEFKETALILLKEGKTIKSLTETIELFIIDEQYEAVSGIKLAIDAMNLNLNRFEKHEAWGAKILFVLLPLNLIRSTALRLYITMVVWLVADCGLLSYQTTLN